MIKVFATNEDGEGYVQSAGEYEDLEDIHIHVGHYAKDVVITFSEEIEKTED